MASVQCHADRAAPPLSAGRCHCRPYAGSCSGAGRDFHVRAIWKWPAELEGLHRAIAWALAPQFPIASEGGWSRGDAGSGPADRGVWPMRRGRDAGDLAPISLSPSQHQCRGRALAGDGSRAWAGEIGQRAGRADSI